MCLFCQLFPFFSHSALRPIFGFFFLFLVIFRSRLNCSPLRKDLPRHIRPLLLPIIRTHHTSPGHRVEDLSRSRFKAQLTLSHHWVKVLPKGIHPLHHPTILNWSTWRKDLPRRSNFLHHPTNQILLTLPGHGVKDLTEEQALVLPPTFHHPHPSIPGKRRQRSNHHWFHPQRQKNQE